MSWRDRFPGRTFARVDGVDLHYVREGKGPAIVMIHGLGDSHANWRGCVPLLAAKGFDAIALDLKGCGYSERPSRSDYSTARLVEEIRGVLDTLRIKKAVIVGVSYGGHLALRFAITHPERVSALIVSNALAYLEPMSAPFELTLARLPVLKSIAHWFFSHRGLMKTYRVWNFTSTWEGMAERVSEHWRFLRMPGGRKAYMSMLHGIDESLVAAAQEKYGSIRVPTLIVWGDADAWFPVAQAKRLAKAIRGAKLEVVKDGAHLFMEEDPEAFVARALPFLRRATSRSASSAPPRNRLRRGAARRRPSARRARR